MHIGWYLFCTPTFSISDDGLIRWWRFSSYHNQLIIKLATLLCIEQNIHKINKWFIDYSFKHNGLSEYDHLGPFSKRKTNDFTSYIGLFIYNHTHNCWWRQILWSICRKFRESVSWDKRRGKQYKLTHIFIHWTNI